jgi:Hint-domain
VVGEPYDCASYNYEYYQMYNDSQRACFAGECLVQLMGGAEKRVRDVVKGDEVVGATMSALVVCVVKTLSVRGKADLVTFPGGLRITPYHPVLTPTNAWQFPIDLAPLEHDVACAAVYSFVLNRGHTVIIQGMPCASLGHGIEEQVAAHPYFGTQRVVEDLRQMRGWQQGMVELKDEGCLVRDRVTGLVCGLVQEGNTTAMGNRDV